MDYNFDIDLGVNEEEKEQSLKTRIANWRKCHPVLFIILIILASLTVVFLVIGLYLLLSNNSKETVEDGSNYDVSPAANMIKYTDNTYCGSEEENSGKTKTITFSEEVADQSSTTDQTLTEEMPAIEDNRPEFAPWKQYQDTIYSVNSLKEFAKSKGYLDENNKITESGQDILCKKNSINKGAFL